MREAGPRGPPRAPLRSAVGRQSERQGIGPEATWSGFGNMGRTAGSGGWMVMVLIGFAAVAVLVVAALWRFSAQPEEEFDPVAQANSRALHTDILKRRYANGEIDREYYLRRLSDLSDA